jgi:FkbM family methyltransferase
VSSVARIYNKLKSVIPLGFNSTLKDTIEYLSDALTKKGEFYSSYGEDAILQRFFEHKAWREDQRSFVPFLGTRLKTGFYVDVGAYMPKTFSNTYCFYKRGWRGINIDATPGSIRIFDRVRNRDINLEGAVSDRETELVFYWWGTRSQVNTLSPEAALKRDWPLAQTPREVRVQSLRLDTILDRYLPKDQPITFLSVDVEGHELEVLRSNDWRRYRPEFVVVEKHEDSIHEILKSEVASLLEEVGYSLYSWAKPSLIYKADDVASES